MFSQVAVLGDGAWGTAVALLLAQRADRRVTLWSAREENARILREYRENRRLLPGVPIPPSIGLTTDIAEATAGTDLWIVAIPTAYLRPTLERVAAALRRPVPVLSLTKGLEIGTFLRPSQVIEQVLGPRPLAVLSGPSHAEEVSRGLPTTVVAASADAALASRVQQDLATERFRIYTSSDIVGVELAAALKNIIGIAAGISDGLSFGDNSKAALLTRGVVEMARFGVALGAEHATFFGLAGIGDLITTCISRHGRNRHVGERLARGEKLADILASMSMVAEGVTTTRSVYEKATLMGISMPITTEVYRVLYEGKDPRAAVSDLMLRAPKEESTR
ncbi:MAG: NAD(P)-dependent glycerol-3-phosphate dehydrogenase [Gemmataceae bacterium]|nr:NAD(P)-dependent glycerol-3-phosphate dehydrogenase [Gemmataceae bacterium]MDW8265289.1 NAD(P)H-dependent glycerol-3-phosphate dehydrogenase [Gemmataceae bacterium]